MDDERDEMFAFLTFFKICKMYNVLRSSRRGKRKRIPEERHVLPPARTTIHKPETRRNFSMFSRIPNKPLQKQFMEEAGYVKVELEPKNRLPEVDSKVPRADSKCSAASKLSLFLPEGHEETIQIVDQKSEMSCTDWKLSEQLQSSHSMPQQSVEVKEQINEEVKEQFVEEQTNEDSEENQDIIDTIFDQINDSVISYDEVETQQHSNEKICDFQISFVMNDEDTTHSKQTPRLPEEQSETPAAVKKKRRRRRRPGDPPLPPLPKIKKIHERRYKKRPEHMNRFQESYFQTVFRKIKSEDESRLLQLVRLTRNSFDMIHKSLRYPMKKHKQTILAEERLSITLLYLAHGVQFDLISDKYKLGRSTIRLIVLQTCELLWDVLAPVYMRDPTSEDYVRIASGFQKQWNLPNCAGAIDTKRVPFKTCRRVPGYKWNEVNDLVLVAACDANHLFRSISVTVEPHQSQFYKSILNNTLPLPPGRPLPDEETNCDLSYYLLANKAFPQRPNLMRPYSGDDVSRRASIYNYKLSCGQGICDTAFNILTSMWKVLLTKGSFSIENWDSIIKACIVLHNFVMVNEKQRWFQPDGYIRSTWPENLSGEENNEWIDKSYPVIYASHLESISKMVGESIESGIEARETLADYFYLKEKDN